MQCRCSATRGGKQKHFIVCRKKHPELPEKCVRESEREWGKAKKERANACRCWGFIQKILILKIHIYVRCRSCSSFSYCYPSRLLLVGKKILAIFRKASFVKLQNSLLDARKFCKIYKTDFIILQRLNFCEKQIRESITVVFISTKKSREKKKIAKSEKRLLVGSQLNKERKLLFNKIHCKIIELWNFKIYKLFIKKTSKWRRTIRKRFCRHVNWQTPPLLSPRTSWHRLVVSNCHQHEWKRQSLSATKATKTHKLFWRSYRKHHRNQWSKFRRLFQHRAFHKAPALQEQWQVTNFSFVPPFSF